MPKGGGGMLKLLQKIIEKISLLNSRTDGEEIVDFSNNVSLISKYVTLTYKKATYNKTTGMVNLVLQVKAITDLLKGAVYMVGDVPDKYAPTAGTPMNIFVTRASAGQARAVIYSKNATEYPSNAMMCVEEVIDSGEYIYFSADYYIGKNV